MKRRLADIWPFIFYANLTILFAWARATGANVSINFINDDLMFPSWIIIVIFTAATIVSGMIRIPYRIRRWAFIPIIVYAIIVAISYVSAGRTLVAGLLTGHLYASIGVTAFLWMDILNENHNQRQKNEILYNEIVSEREKFEQLVGKCDGGTNSELVTSHSE